MAVIEMGANHQHEIAELCAIAQPDFGLITNAGKAHLEGFGSLEGVPKNEKRIVRLVKQSGRSCFSKQKPGLFVRNVR